MFDACRTIAFEEVRGKLEKLFSETSLEDLELIWKDQGQIFLWVWLSQIVSADLSQAEDNNYQCDYLGKTRAALLYRIPPRKKFPTTHCLVEKGTSEV